MFRLYSDSYFHMDAGGFGGGYGLMFTFCF